MKHSLLLSVLLVFFSVFPVSVRGQLIVHDPIANINHLVNQVNNYTNMVTNLTMLQRYGDLGALMDSFQKVLTEVQTVGQAVENVKRIGDGQTWRVPNLLQKVGLDPKAVGVSQNIVKLYDTAKQDSKYGTNQWSIMKYDAALGGIDKALSEYRQANIRERSVENAVAADHRREATAKMLEKTAKESQVETHVQLTNSLLQQSIEANAEDAKLKAERDLAEDARRQVEVNNKNEYLKVRARTALGGI